MSDDNDAWRPVHIEDTRELDQLVGDPRVRVFDTIAAQRRDLSRILPAPDAGHLAEPTRWYYYPWRLSLVHVLGPQAFHTVRTDRNRNKLTAGEQQRLRRLTVGVVGLSAGHAIAHTLALEGICGQLRLADFDDIELSNLNRLPGTVFDLGVNKTVVAARRIGELDPYVDVRIDPAGLRLDSIDAFMEGLDVVIEECDSFDVKLAVRDAARRHRIPLIMETSDRGLLDVERYDLEPKRRLFHGRLGEMEPAELAGLSMREKVPFAIRILDADQLSARVVASMTEVGETVSSWPQLAGDINLGAATAAAAVRRLGLGKPLPSGRVRVDVDAKLDEIAEPAPATIPDTADDALAEPEPAPAEAPAAVLHAARLAPSGGNTQPWQLDVDGSGLRIWLDPEQTSTLDVRFRGSHVAIGAALFNARVAAARHGVLGHVQISPDGEGRGPVAAIRFADGGAAGLGELYASMLRRVSNRHLNEPVPLPDHVVPDLQEAASGEGAELHVVTDRARLRELSELLGESDRLRFLTPRLHREMMRELRWPGIDSLDWGLDVRTLGLDAADLAKLGVARRADVMEILAEQDLGRALGEPSRDRVRSAAGLAVVTVAESGLADYVHGGQAVERVWIEAERLGLAVHVMSPVFIYAVDHADYEELSPRYSDRLRLLHQDFARMTGIRDRNVVLVMRIGYARPVSARSRRLPADRILRAV